MIRVRLENPRGETVHTRHIYDFSPTPEIIRWGSRHFVNVGGQAGAVVYREAQLYAFDEDPGLPAQHSSWPAHEPRRQWQTGGDRGR